MARLGQVTAGCQALIGHDISNADFWKRRGFTDADLDCAIQTAGFVSQPDGSRNLIAGVAPGSPTPTEPDAAAQLRSLTSTAVGIEPLDPNSPFWQGVARTVSSLPSGVQEALQSLPEGPAVPGLPRSVGGIPTIWLLVAAGGSLVGLWLLLR